MRTPPERNRHLKKSQPSANGNMGEYQSVPTTDQEKGLMKIPGATVGFSCMQGFVSTVMAE